MVLSGVWWLKRLRALLLLGRVSNLPTVWSNCLAGWWLGGAGEWERLLPLCLGATALYVGGMFLNDAFDSGFDRQHRTERPIPSGAISERAVWVWGVVWLITGLVLFALLGRSSFWLAVCLCGSIILYDAVHKVIVFSPLLMALCRFFLYLLAASVGAAGVTGLALWSAIVLAAYIVGLSYVARRETIREPLQAWPCALLAAPLLLALLVNAGEYRLRGVILSCIFLAWVSYSLYFLFRRRPPEIGRTVSYLLAGIVLVDWLAVADYSAGLAAVLILLFAAALVSQRFIPAT